MDVRDDRPLRYEVQQSLRTQAELNPIEAWLKLNAEQPWKMEFQGVSSHGNKQSKGQHLLVTFRFALKADAERFQSMRTGHRPVDHADKTAQKRQQNASERSSAAPIKPPRRSTPTATSHAESGDPEEFVKCAADLVRNVQCPHDVDISRRETTNDRLTRGASRRWWHERERAGDPAP